MDDRRNKLTRIASYCADANRHEDSKLCIILGAGASVSAGIPLANAITNEVREKYPHRLNELTEEQIARNYPLVMNKLDADMRKEILNPHFEKAKINWGHIALAQLIKSGKVKRVLTFNFDFVLQKALSLLDEHIPIYDFAVAPTENMNRLSHPCVIHLHGQGHGLAMVNDDEESQKQCEAFKPLLKDCLQNHTTLIAGYSAESDHAGKVIAEGYDNQTDLLWSEFNDAPNPMQTRITDKSKAHFFGGLVFDETMIAIANHLKVWPPKILSRPIEHLLDTLEPVAEYPKIAGYGFQALNFFNTTRLRLMKSSVIARDEDLLIERIQTEIATENFTDELANQILAHDLDSDPLLVSLISSYFIYRGHQLANQITPTTMSNAPELIRKAIESFDFAYKIDPHEIEILNMRTSAVIMLSTLVTKESKKDLLLDAQVRFIEAKKKNAFTSFPYALVEVLLGNHDASLDELEACEKENRFPEPELLLRIPDFIPLHDNPRFTALLNKVTPKTPT